VIHHDVIVVGGGAAGLRAAIAAVEADPSATVAMVSKVYPMRSHTVSAEGGAAAVAREDDDFESHGYDTVKGSDFLGDQDLIRYFVEQCPAELTRLEHWGCPWSRNEDGTVATRAFGGMTTKRTWYAADKVGFHMLHTLFQHSMRFDRIVRYDEQFVTKLLVQDDGVRGVAALDVRTGEMRVFAGRAVILATGGAGRCFPFTTNGNIKTGDGMVLAYRAGGGLKDMEKQIGIERDSGIAEMRGTEAITLWGEWKRGDRAAYDRLVTYCKADCTNLKDFADHVYQRKWDATFTQHAKDIDLDAVSGNQLSLF